MKLTKTLAALLAALMISASLAACGGSETPAAPAPDAAPASDAAAPEATAPAEAAPEAAAPAEATGEKMTEDAYKAKVLELYSKVVEAGAGAANVDAEDPEAVMAAMTTIVDISKSAYTEMGNLNAPDSFAEAAANIKTGAAASVEVLSMSLEMMGLDSVEMTEEESAKKAAEYQEKATKLSGDVQKLNDGLTAVLGADFAATPAQ